MTVIAEVPTVSPDDARAMQQRLLVELEPVVEELVNKHIAVAKEWFPHEYIPWSDGTTFDGVLAGQAWSEEQATLPEAVRGSLFLNLLTEDNLPSYHRELASSAGREGAWGEWVGRWTAEEGRHGIVLRDYLMVSRQVDPIELERARMIHMQNGHHSPYEGSLVKAMSYVSFQELATRVSHRNTGLQSGDPIVEQMMARVAADENLHMLFYRNTMAAVLQVEPDAALSAIYEIVRDFEMPGAGMPGWARTSMQIAVAGIYNMRVHLDEVLSPVLRAWGVWDMEGLGEMGEKAREGIAEVLAQVEAAASKFEAFQAARLERLAKKG